MSNKKVIIRVIVRILEDPESAADIILKGVKLMNEVYSDKSELEPSTKKALFEYRKSVEGIFGHDYPELQKEEDSE